MRLETHADIHRDVAILISRREARRSRRIDARRQEGNEQKRTDHRFRGEARVRETEKRRIKQTYFLSPMTRARREVEIELVRYDITNCIECRELLPSVVVRFLRYSEERT